MIITIIFYLYSDTGPHIVRRPLRPLTLITFAKKIHFLSFSNILDFLEIFHIFLTIFPNRTATLRIARYVAFWRQAATPAATAIFILATDLFILLSCMSRERLTPFLFILSTNSMLLPVKITIVSSSKLSPILLN